MFAFTRLVLYVDQDKKRKLGPFGISSNFHYSAARDVRLASGGRPAQAMSGISASLDTDHKRPKAELARDMLDPFV